MAENYPQPDPDQDKPDPDQADAIALRRLCSLDWAANAQGEDMPSADFYHEGFSVLRELLGEFSAEVTIADIGGGGRYILDAAVVHEFRGHIIAVDPNEKNYANVPQQVGNCSLAHVWAFGENTTLPADTVDTSFLLNVIFRGKPLELLRESQRITKRLGYLMVSTNGLGHAFWRHNFERRVSEIMKHRYA